MQREEIINVIEKYLRRAVENVDEGQMDIENKFTDYGANSLDIVEIVSATMRELKIKIPRTELGDIKNIAGLVDKFMQYANDNGK